jgi:hypothetical protein
LPDSFPEDLGARTPHRAGENLLNIQTSKLMKMLLPASFIARKQSSGNFDLYWGTMKITKSFDRRKHEESRNNYL